LGGDKGVGNEFVYIRKTQPNLNRNSIIETIGNDFTCRAIMEYIPLSYIADIDVTYETQTT